MWPKVIVVIGVMVALGALAAGSPHYPKYCSECEEEVWEEVPCDEISTTTSAPTSSTTTAAPTTSTPPTPTTTTTTAMPYTKAASTTSTARPPTTTKYVYYTTTMPPEVPTSTPPGPYQKCYCECKVGCREFCRKVVVNAEQKEVMQVSKTSENVAAGHIETKHLHQRKFIPAPYGTGQHPPTYGANPKPHADGKPAKDPVLNTYPVESSNEIENSYESTKPIYNAPAAAVPAQSHSASPYPSQKNNYYSETMLDSSYSIDELTRLLQMEGIGKTGFAHSPSGYYSPPDAHNYHAAPLYGYNAVSDVKHAASSAAAAATSSAGSSSSSANYISKNRSDASSTYTATTPAPSSDQLSESTVNNHPAFDFALDNYLKDYMAVQPPQDNSYSPYHSSYSLPYR